MSAPVRVLVCDDQVLIRTGLSTIIDAQPDLEVAGECGDGRTAVELAGRLRPDVVVMDVRMPVLDGIEATRLLAGAGVEHPVKVLVVTTFNLDEYVYEALRAERAGSCSRTRRRTGCCTASAPWPRAPRCWTPR